MDANELAGILDFIKATERLKVVTRTAWKSNGEPESVAEHTWRLCLLVVALQDEFRDVDVGRLLAMCIIHDLGEAIGGDISAVLQQPGGKSDAERRDLLELLEPLPANVRDRIVALWDDYETAASPEAKIAKALDKLETIMQHNQGANPPGFDYRFNLDYGKKFTSGQPVIVAIRDVLDRETERRAQISPPGNVLH